MVQEKKKEASSLTSLMSGSADSAWKSMEDAAKKMHKAGEKMADNMHKAGERMQDNMHKAQERMAHNMHETSDNISRGISDFKKMGSTSSSSKHHQQEEDNAAKEPSETTPLVANEGKTKPLEGREVKFREQPAATPENNDTSSSSKLLSTLHWIQKKQEPILAALCAVAVCQLIADYQSILQNQVPIHVSVVWALLAMMGGSALGRMQTKDEIEQAVAAQRRAAARAQHEREGSVRSEITMDQSLEKQGFGAGLRSLFATMPKSKGTWTNLRGSSTSSSKQQRKKFGHGLVSVSMTRALFGVVPQEQKKSVKDAGFSSKELEEALKEDAVMGNTVDDPERLRAKSLEQDYVQPICKTRGLDVFMADCAEPDLAEHSFLIENGLRDCPTFILNLMTQWGNVAMYFELPEWVKDWDNLPQESPDDPEDVIALKRFLHGDDAYRKPRLKCLPVLVDGPGPIRFVAPPKSTVTIIRPCLPAVWKKHPAKMDSKGNVIQHCCLEMDGDLMSERGMRTGAALIKRYLGSIVGDCALLIEKPYQQEEEEPRACLGLCRFDRIDISGCPDMPPRMDQGKTEVERDMLRASVLAGKPIAVAAS